MAEMQSHRTPAGAQSMSNAAQSAAAIGANKQRAADRASREQMAAEALAHDKLARAAGYDHEKGMEGQRHLNRQELARDEEEAQKRMMEFKNGLDIEMAEMVRQQNWDDAWNILQLDNAKKDKEAYNAGVRRMLMVGPPGSEGGIQGFVSNQLGMDASAFGGQQGQTLPGTPGHIPFGGDQAAFTNAVMGQAPAMVKMASGAQSSANVAQRLSNDMLETTMAQTLQGLMHGDISISQQTLGTDSGMANSYFESMGRGAANVVSNIGNLAGWTDATPEERAQMMLDYQKTYDPANPALNPEMWNVMSNGEFGKAGVAIWDAMYEWGKIGEAGKQGQNILGMDDPTPDQSPERIAQNRFQNDFVQYFKGNLQKTIKDMAPTAEHEAIYMEEVSNLLSEAIAIMGSSDQSESVRMRNLKNFQESHKKLNEYYRGEGADPIKASARTAALSLLGNVAYGLNENLESPAGMSMYVTQLDEDGKPIDTESSRNRKRHHQEFVRQLRGLGSVLDYMTTGATQTPRDERRMVEQYRQMTMNLLTADEISSYGPTFAGDPMSALAAVREQHVTFSQRLAEEGAFEGLTEDQLNNWDKLHYGSFTSEEIDAVVDTYVSHAIAQVDSSTGEMLPQAKFPAEFHLMFRTPYAQQQVKIAQAALLARHDQKIQAGKKDMRKLAREVYKQDEE